MMIEKPVTEKKPRKPLVRKTRIKRGEKRMQHRNPRQHTARMKRTAAFHRTPAFEAAGNEAMERAGYQCEFTTTVVKDGQKVEVRCPEREHLERHCEKYPKTRPVEARDITILCGSGSYRNHHGYVETTKYAYRHTHRRKAI